MYTGTIPVGPMAVSETGDTIATSGRLSGTTVNAKASGSSGGNVAASACGVADAIQLQLPSWSSGRMADTAAPFTEAGKRTVSRPSVSIASRAPPRSIAVTRTFVPRGTRSGGTGSIDSSVRPRYAG